VGGLKLAQFDPYQAWLGISTSNQPIDNYRLLGLRAFESDPRVIEAAVNQRLAHVTSFQTGPHAAEAQRVLQHLTFARTCLLNPQQKATYDEQLRRQQPGHEPLDAMLVDLAEKSQKGRSRSSGSTWIVALGIATVGLIAVGIGVFFVSQIGGTRDVKIVIDKSNARIPSSDSGNATIDAQSSDDSPWDTAPADRDPEDSDSDDPTGPADLPDDTNVDVATSATGLEAPKEPLSVAIKRLLDSSKASVPARQEGDDPAGTTISVLRLMPARPFMAGGANAGVWEMVDGKLQGLDSGIMLPIDPPYDYQLDFTIEHLRKDGHLFVGFPVVDSRVGIVLDWEVNGQTISGIDLLDKQGCNTNGTQYTGQIVQEGKPTEIRLRVRGNHIQLFADGKSIVDWTGDPRRLAVNPYWGVPGKRPTFFGLTGEVRISKIELTPYLKSVVPPRGEPQFSLTPAVKLPAPQGDELAQARAAARKIFEDELASAREDRDRQELADMMWEKAYENNHNPALKFGLLYEAYELSAKSFFAVWSMRYALDLSEMYDIDRYELQAQALQRFASDVTAETDESDVRSIARAVSLTFEDAMAAERFDIAVRLAESLKRLNSRKRMSEVKPYSDRRMAEASFTKDLYDAANAYRDAPRDAIQTPQAKLILGRYLCFAKGDWDQGLPLLASGSDENLATVAMLELSNTPDLERTIADGWSELAARATGLWKNEYLNQAYYWHGQTDTPASPQSTQAKPDRNISVPRNRVQYGLVSAYRKGYDTGILRRTSVEKQMYRAFGNGSPDSALGGDDFTGIWKGFIRAPLPGKYKIGIDSDDGSRLTIDGVQLWDALTQGGDDRSREVELTGELQSIEVMHHEVNGSSFCMLTWGNSEYSDSGTVEPKTYHHDPRLAKRLHADETITTFDQTMFGNTTPGDGLFCIFEDQPELEAGLTEGSARPTLDRLDRYSGDIAICMPYDQRFGVYTLGINEGYMAIRENPRRGQYRYVRFAWKKPAKTPMGIQFYVKNYTGAPTQFQDWKRFHVGHRPDEFPLGGASIQVSEEVPAEWTVVTRDLAKDFGECNMIGIALSTCDDNFALFDHIYLARHLEDFDKLGKVNPPAEPAKSE
jgi:hypothetical protein